MDAVDINKLLQDCWGLKAWDDFSQDYWAQGTGYSYGPFSPTLIELSRQGIKWDKLQLDPGGGVVAGFSEANAKPALAALLGSGSASAGVNGAATYQGAGFNVEAYCRAQHGPGPTAPTSPPSSQWLAQALGMARALLSQVVTLASDTKVEWGFGIFRQGDALVSVGPYTDYDQGFVCTRNWRGVWLVNGHSHVVGPLPSGFESTVGGDKAVAQSNPAVIFLMGSPGGPMYNYTGGILRRW